MISNPNYYLLELVRFVSAGLNASLPHISEVLLIIVTCNISGSHLKMNLSYSLLLFIVSAVHVFIYTTADFVYIDFNETTGLTFVSDTGTTNCNDQLHPLVRDVFYICSLTVLLLYISNNMVELFLRGNYFNVFFLSS